MTKYVVTGGCGFIGSNLVESLLLLGTREDEVVVIDNCSTGYLRNKADLEYAGEACETQLYFKEVDIREDLTQYEDLLEADVIFHIAALARIVPSFKKPVLFTDVNCQGTSQVLELARQSKARVVYAGSSSFYFDPYCNPYAFSKWIGEEYCKMYAQVYGVDVGIARFFNVYGPRMVQSGENAACLGIFQDQKRRGLPLTVTGDGEQRRDFCVTGDTLVLMSDFTWKPICEVVVGDEVISFGEPENKKRKFTTTKVTAASSYVSSNVYEIKTDEGTVCATGNHPWLMCRRGYRDTDSLMRSLDRGVHKSLKKFSDPIHAPKNRDFKHGYLAGSLAGDGYFCENMNSGNKHSSGLEVTDLEFHERFLSWSKEFGIDLNVRQRQPKRPGSKLVHVAHSGKMESYALYNELANDQDFSNCDFCRGYLSAIFDGEGEYDTINNKCLRISNKSHDICDNIRHVLSVFEFRWSEWVRDDGLIYFRLLGGLNEEVRFFATFQPAIQRKRPDMTCREVKGKLSRIQSIKPIDAVRVFNIEVEETHTYIANGFLCHNTHVHDIASGLRAIANSPKKWKGEVFNLGRSNNYSINEVAAMFDPVSIEYLPARPGEAKETLADISFTQEQLGWKPVKNLPDYVSEFVKGL